MLCDISEHRFIVPSIAHWLHVKIHWNLSTTRWRQTNKVYSRWQKKVLKNIFSILHITIFTYVLIFLLIAVCQIAFIIVLKSRQFSSSVDQHPGKVKKVLLKNVSKLGALPQNNLFFDTIFNPYCLAYYLKKILYQFICLFCPLVIYLFICLIYYFYLFI